MCLAVKEPPCFQQVFSGGVQENPLFPLARQPDCLQPRLLVLRNLENHAQFQVRHRRLKNLFHFTVCYMNAADKMVVHPEVTNSRTPTSSCVICWTTSTGSFSAAAMERRAPCLHRGASDCQPQRGKAARERLLY